MCEEETIWEIPKPSSPAFCRPVHFQFVKESEAVVNSEVTKMTEEISAAIRPTTIHKLVMTMVNAKICTYLQKLSPMLHATFV